jgi:hypothetical protein
VAANTAEANLVMTLEAPQIMNGLSEPEIDLRAPYAAMLAEM